MIYFHLFMTVLYKSAGSESVSKVVSGQIHSHTNIDTQIIGEIRKDNLHQTAVIARRNHG